MIQMESAPRAQSTQMLFVEEFIEELNHFIESQLILNGKNGNKNNKLRLTQDWSDQLRARVHILVDKYGSGGNNNNNNGIDNIDSAGRSRGQSFFIGDESSSIASASIAHDTPTMKDAECQVDIPASSASNSKSAYTPKTPTKTFSADDAQLLAQMRTGQLKHRELEKYCKPGKAVEVRRLHLAEVHKVQLERLPYVHYDYSEVKDACCENVIGYMPLPTGLAGPLRFDDELVPIPLTTTEGALVASVSRGCRSINDSIDLLGPDAFYVQVIRDGMSRAPVLEFDRLKDASECYLWIQRQETFANLKNAFDETSSFASLQRIEPNLEGNYLYVRFVASTGDAMGMNMVTKGTGRALALVKRQFPQAKLVSISGNLCVDKKASALNWIEGRGKTVVAEAILPNSIVEKVLKSSVDKMVKLGHAKLLVGSSAACTIGGWNAHAANIVAAMFLATGQDAAQVVSSSMCLTQLTKRPEDGALHITCTMNCLEVGTIGGGTVLSPQTTCLEMLGCRRSGLRPGKNAERLARLICSTVMAGELSLLASQCNEGDLERTHLRLNRSSRNLALSNSAYPLISLNPSTNNLQRLSGSPISCKKSISMAIFPQTIPENQPISVETRPKEEEQKRQRSDTKNSTASIPSSRLEVMEASNPRESRTRSTLSVASQKLLKKANSGHMPCGPL